MLGIVLKILSILGIVLLVLFALLTAALLLVLFFPFTYRVSGKKDGEGFRLAVKVNWLFGLCRVRFRYPQTGHLTVKALCFTLFDMKIPPEKAARPETETKKVDSGAGKAEKSDGGKAESEETASGGGKTRRKEAKASKGAKGSPEGTGSSGGGKAEPGGESEKSGMAPEKTHEGEKTKILEKVRKIKYTICGIYDKIKKIWENISYYIALLQEENTKQLFAHAMLRARKVLKSLRPRRVKGQLTFGTGAPDTTGYAYGAYCALSSLLGAGFYVTPDFDRKILEGEIDVAGHVTVWILAVNGLKLLLDKRLRMFIRKLKKGLEKSIG